MADEELLEPVDEMGDDEEGEEEEGGSSLMRYLPIILVVLVLQVVIGYVLVSWIFSPSDDAPPEGGQAMVAEEGAEPAEPDAAADAGNMVIEETIYEQLEPIVVNPAGTEGLRFLSATVHLGLANPEVAAAIEAKKKKSKIVDTLYGILSSKTIPQLDPQRHDELKEEIKTELNAFLGKNAVIAVYFQGFVLQ